MRRDKGYRIIKRPGRKVEGTKSVDDLLREMREDAKQSYREQSLRIHGLICPKFAREFEEKDRHLLTVHHKDGNSKNNPPDGSNWENLCVYCHDDEHSRSTLFDYLNDQKKK